MTLPEDWVAKVSVENVRETNNTITVKDIILKRAVCLYQTLGIQTLAMLITELENNNHTKTLFDVKTCLRFPMFFLLPMSLQAHYLTYFSQTHQKPSNA